jgi:hypothetical protein
MNNTNNNPANSINLSTTNNGLEQLKQLFYEHFKLDDTCLLNGYHLDFDSFNQIILKWIEKLKTEEVDTSTIKEDHNRQHKQKQTLKYKKSFDFATKNFNSYSKKQHHSKILGGIGMNTLGTSETGETSNVNNKEGISLREASASSTDSSSSIPSISLSDEDIHVHSHDLTNEFEFTQQNLMDSSNSSFVISDLTSENRQLRQNVNDLRIQLRNAEETNSQMVHDIESQTEKCETLTRVNTELNAKLEASLIDDEYLRKQVEFHKTRAIELEEQINLLNGQVRNVGNSLRRSEEEVTKLNSQFQDCALECEKNLNDLNEQKVSL